MLKTIHHWKKMQLVQETTLLPNGLSCEHTKIHHPGAAVILPITDQGQILLLRQYRPALKKWLLELPAGTREPGEDFLTCAQRELIEETGYQAKQFESLGALTPMAGLCDEIQHLFIATELHINTTLPKDEDEVIEVEFWSKARIEQAIISGEISDAKTLACLYRASLAKRI